MKDNYKTYEEDYFGWSNNLSDNNNKNMENGIGKLSWINLKSALVYGVIAVALAIIANQTIFGLDWRVLVDVGIMAVLTSFVKNLLTTDEGNFVGSVKVVDEPDSK